jgi:hypothetical protein
MTPLTVKERIDAAVTGGVEYKGTFNATAGTPSLLNAEKGDLYIIDTVGTIYGQTWAVGDHLLINEDMGGSITNSKIDKIDNTDAVTSVNTLTGPVVLSADDLEGDHAGVNYVGLATDTIDVHLSGIDTALASVGGNQLVRADIKNTSFNADRNSFYRIGTDALTMTMPSSGLSEGDLIGVYAVSSNEFDLTVSGNLVTINASSVSSTTIKVNKRSIMLWVYDASTSRWVQTSDSLDTGSSSDAGIFKVATNAEAEAATIVDKVLVPGLMPYVDLSTLDNDLSADDFPADHTAENYTPANANIDGHLSGIDTALASAGGNQLVRADIKNTSFNADRNSFYRIGTDALTMTMPSSGLSEGDLIGVYAVSSNEFDLTVSGNLVTINASSVSSTTIKVNKRSIMLWVYDASTSRWVQTSDSLDTGSSSDAGIFKVATNAEAEAATIVDKVLVPGLMPYVDLSTLDNDLSADDFPADHTAENYTPANANIDGHLSGIDTALASAGGLAAVVDDEAPQLGGPLDVNGQAITSASNGDVAINPDGTGDISIGADIIPDADATHTIGDEDNRFISIYSDVNGAVRFKAKNDHGSAISKGQVVYIKGVSGTVPTVGLAQANSASTMPAFGLALTAANDQADVEIITFGNLTDYNTTTYSLSANDTVYVSSATAGALTNSAPTGEANLIQNIGRVVRADASAGIIKVGGAGRSAATPNLDSGKIFLGNGSNQSVSTALSAINLTSFNDDLGSTYQPLDAGLTSISGLTTSADKMIYTTASDTYAVADLTSAGRALLDDADATAQRTTLGLGTAATSASTDFLASTAGLDDLSDVAYTAGAGIDNYVLTYDHGTTSWGAEAAPTASAASETVAGVIEIATNAEAEAGTATDKALVPSNISSIDLSQADNTTSGFISGITGESLNDLSDVSFTAGAGIDNYVLTYDNSTTSWGAEAAPTASAASETVAGIIEIATNAEAEAATATDKALVPSNIGSIDLSSFNDDLSYQPLDAGLTSISGLTTSADKMIYTTASDTYAVADLTSAGRALLDDADAAAQRTTLGLGTAATSASTDFLASTAGLNDLSDVSFTAGAGIDNYVLTYDHSTTSWGAEASQGGGGGFTYSAITADPAPAVKDTHYSCTGSFTITLPAVSGTTAGDQIRVKNIGTGTVTIDGASSETVDGATTFAMDVQWSSITLVSNGSTGWEIV